MNLKAAYKQHEDLKELFREIKIKKMNRQKKTIFYSNLINKIKEM